MHCVHYLFALQSHAYQKRSLLHCSCSQPLLVRNAEGRLVRKYGAGGVVNVSALASPASPASPRGAAKHKFSGFPCKVCPNPALAKNYGFCEGHRIPVPHTRGPNKTKGEPSRASSVTESGTGAGCSRSPVSGADGVSAELMVGVRIMFDYDTHGMWCGGQVVGEADAAKPGWHRVRFDDGTSFVIDLTNSNRERWYVTPGGGGASGESPAGKKKGHHKVQR